MLLLDRQTGATAQPPGEANRSGVPAGRIQLRLRADGQVLDLLPGKTTIGSSPRCNVRIEQPGVQPLHCLIVEGTEGLRVRSWVANTTLNGVRFDESALAVGDCLSLGSVELEVVDPRAGMSQPTTVVTPAAESKDAEQIRVGRDQARVRSRQLLDTLRQERTSHQELCQQVAKLQESHLDAIAEQNTISDKLERSLAELAAARRQLDEYRSVETERQQLAERNEQLGFEIGELSAQINELKQRQTEAATNQQKVADDHAALEEQHRQLIETNDRLQSEAGQRANEKATADEQSRQLGEQKSQLQGEFNRLADEKNALAEERRQHAEANARLQSDVCQLANEKGAADEQCRQLADQKSQLQNDVVQLANEKAAADEQSRQLAEQKSQLQSEVGRLTNQKDELEAEREALRRQNEQLLGEARELAGERGSLADERTSLYEERSDLRQQNEALRVRIAQLDQENSALVVGKMTLVEQCEALHREANQLQVRVAELSEENATLAAAKATLSDEQARLAADQARLAELEREMRAAVNARENTSAELYRALLQLAELEERDGQNKAVIEAYESLSKEHDQLHEETNQLKEQIHHLSEERAAVQGARQAASSEAAALGESQRRMADDNAALVASLEDARLQLELVQREQANLASLATELERERAAKLQAESETAAAIAEGQRRLEEQERRFAEQSNQFNDRLQQQAEQSREFAESISMLERQLAATGEMRESLARDREEVQLQLADVASHGAEQARRIQELESQLAAAELERELAAKLQAESDVAAAIAHGQRQLEEQERRFAEHAQQFAEQSTEFNDRLRQQAEQSREFAESISILERQLAATGELRDSLARAGEEAQLQLADAESRRVEQARRIQDLESQLAAAEERAAKAAELAASSSAASWKNAAAESENRAAEQAESASHVASEQPTEFHWSTARAESASQDEVNERDRDEVISSALLDESITGEAAWDRPANVTGVWQCAGAEVSTSDSVAEPTPDAWLNTFASGTAAEEPNLWGEKVSPQVPVDPSTFGEDDGASLNQQPVEDPAATGQSFVWNQAAEQPGSAFVEPVFAKSEESVQRETKSESSSKPKPEPVSFIERYSHLLVEDGAANEAKPDRSNELAQSRPIATVTQRPEEASLASKSEEEDSLEQYMAKLLQRVRGDAPRSPATTTQPSESPLNAPPRNDQARSTERTAPLAIPSLAAVADSEIAATETESTDRHTPAKQKAPSPAPQTNLGALRALANETARRAISRHELRKHRRNAVTKVIVATLAGVTSLWLMLDSPDWLSIQFVTGCMSLLVAAFWAGETYRTLVESLRAGAYDGPEAGLVEPEPHQAPALPIDVENRS